MGKNYNLYLYIGTLFALLTIISCSSNQKMVEIPIISKLTNSISDFKTDGVLSKQPTLNEYILYALSESADIRNSYNLYMAAQQRGAQVSALPEPILSYGYFINSIETRVGPMKHRVGIAQPIPWFGKLSLKEDMANAEARATYNAFLLRKNKLVSDVIGAYYELAYLKDARSITDANLELLKRWEKVLAQRYRSQSGTQADLIKVQVELGKLEDKLRELDDFVDPLRARFNALLNRPMSSKVMLKEGLLTLKQHPKFLDFIERDKKVLAMTVSKHNPELKLLDILIEARDKGIRLARKDYYPDFSIGADYTLIGDFDAAGSNSGDDGLATVFSINIPINFSKYNAGLSEAKHRKKAAEQQLVSRTYALKAQLAKNLFDITDSRRKINLFADTLVPKAEEALESTFTAFEAGSAGFLDLLDTERELLDFQLMLSRARADLAIKTSDLRALIGDYSSMKSQNKGEIK